MKIEKNIPIPERSARGAKRKHKFHELSAGDSYLVPESDRKSAQIACHTYGFRSGKSFVTQKQDDGCLRIWRKS